MEHLVRVSNEQDRQTLAWLRRQVGDAALVAAIAQCGGAGKPWLSSVCRCLRVTPPDFPALHRHAPSSVAEQALVTIRTILSARAGATSIR